MTETPLLEKPEVVVPDSLELLSRRLRENPVASQHNASDLAQEFGLEESFVQSVLNELRQPAQRFDAWDALKGGCRRAAASSYTSVRDRIVWWTERPVAALVVSVAVFAVVSIVLSSVMAWSVVPVPVQATLGGLNVLAFLGIIVFHLAVMVRHGRARFAFIGAATVFVPAVVYTSFGVVTTRATMPMHPLALVLISSFVMMIAYVFFAFPTALLGGVIKVQRESRQEIRLDRNALIERLFEVEARLEQIKANGDLTLTKHSLLDKLRSAPYLLPLSAIVGFVYGILMLLVVGGYTQAKQIGIRENDPFLITTWMLLFVMSTLANFVLGYMAGKVWRAILAVLIAVYAAEIPLVVPLGEFGPEYLLEQLTFERFLVNLATAVFIGLVAGIGAQIDASHFRKLRIRNNDPAQLLAEQIRLQRMLNVERQATCVMSVDVARSTRMKQGEDALKIEFSFREYQKLVAETTERFGGSVFSTAGDGAIVAFPSCPAALAAARAIVREMPSFNERKNRLEQAFRVRIGLHTGETYIQLSEAPFSNLIDIAAHIEKIAPVGGIAVSRAVADHLEGERLAELAEQIDGQSAFIVLNLDEDE